MRNYIYFISLFILSGYLISCDSEYYSCDPLADEWVKQNLVEVQTMSRSTWLNLEKREPIKRAAYVAFHPEMKRNFWTEKIMEVANDFGWNKKEIDHLSLLLDYVKEADIFNRNGISEEFELFVYKWNEYAIKELGWTRKLIYAITADGDRLLDKDGNTASTSQEEFDKKRIRTNSEDAGYPNCSCSQTSDWCDIFGEMPPWILSCNSYNYNCTQVSGCGTFWQFTCDGICKSPVA